MILLAAAVIADLCGASPAPAAAPDRGDAAAYARVADDARAHGEVRVAAIAYRKAIALDPGDVRLRHALAALCRADAAPSENAALLAAIARLRRGEVAAARATFARLAAGQGEAAASAHFFLGLIALRRHEGGRAVRELELAARNPAYAEPARRLLRLARRDGLVTAMLLAEPELDTNPQLLPDTPPAGATTGTPHADEDLLLVATLGAHPVPWLALRDVVAWRRQREQAALDYLGEHAQAGLELGAGPGHLEIRYDLDADVLDGSSYLIAHQGHAAYRHELGAITLGASYALRHRAYQQSAQAAFTGWVHAGQLTATVRLTPRVDLELTALGRRELTVDPAFTDLAGGARAGVRARLGARVRLAASLEAWAAAYDGAEPDGALRRDLHGEGSADLEVDLDDHVIAVAGTSLEVNTSTVEDFRYWKLVVRAGLALAFGGP